MVNLQDNSSHFDLCIWFAIQLLECGGTSILLGGVGYSIVSLAQAQRGSFSFPPV